MSQKTGLDWTIWLLAAILLVLTFAGSVAQWRLDHATVGIIALVQAPIYVAAAWLIIRRQLASKVQHRALVSILLIGVALRLIVIAAPPVSSDLYRYIWDGRVQAAGVNPYRYLPADPALRGLRDDTVYPLINRAGYAPTIYPPAAQIVFLAVTRISESPVAMKVSMVAFEALAVWAILQLLAKRGISATRVLLYAWHPLPLWEFAGSGHADAVAIALLLLACVAVDRRMPLAAGAALAASVLVKFFPIVAMPALYKRWDWRLPVAFLVSASVLYAPYIGVGAKVFGFLGGYVAEEGLTNGSGVFLWSLLASILPLPSGAVALYFAAATALLAAIALALQLRRHQVETDMLAAMVLSFVFVVLLSPHYPWYFAWLIPFLCFHPFAAGVYLTCAATYLHLSNWPPSIIDGALIYGVAVAVLLGELVYRYLKIEVQRGRAIKI